MKTKIRVEIEGSYRDKETLKWIEKQNAVLGDQVLENKSVIEFQKNEDNDVIEIYTVTTGTKVSLNDLIRTIEQLKTPNLKQPYSPFPVYGM